MNVEQKGKQTLLLDGRKKYYSALNQKKNLGEKIMPNPPLKYLMVCLLSLRALPFINLIIRFYHTLQFVYVLLYIIKGSSKFLQPFQI